MRKSARNHTCTQYYVSLSSPANPVFFFFFLSRYRERKQWYMVTAANILEKQQHILGSDCKSAGPSWQNLLQGRSRSRREKKGEKKKEKKKERKIKHYKPALPPASVSVSVSVPVSAPFFSAVFTAVSVSVSVPVPVPERQTKKKMKMQSKRVRNVEFKERKKQDATMEITITGTG